MCNCSVLVANNGIAAVKFIRSIRSWAYKTFGNERAVALVAMATPEDMRIDAEHIRMADQFVEVPGGSNNNNYGNVQLIVQVADRANVDAVWPGWCVVKFHFKRAPYKRLLGNSLSSSFHACPVRSSRASCLAPVVVFADLVTSLCAVQLMTYCLEATTSRMWLNKAWGIVASMIRQKYTAGNCMARSQQTSSIACSCCC